MIIFISQTLQALKNMKHLQSANQNYVQHLWSAVLYSVALALLSVVMLMHGIAPVVFKKTVSNALIWLLQKMDKLPVWNT